MVFQTTSPLTAALSSAQHSGLNSFSAWALYTISPPPTTLRPTAWWRGVTNSSKMPYGSAPPGPTGHPTSHGCSWASGPPPRRICASPQLSSSAVPLWYFLASFLVSRSRRQLCSGSPQGLHLPTSPPGVPAPPRSPKRSLSSRRGAKPPLSPAYSGPFAVVSRSPKFSVLDLGERHESVSVDWLKPHAGASIFTRPPPLAVATLIYRWHLQRCHLGGGGVV